MEDSKPCTSKYDIISVCTKNIIKGAIRWRQFTSTQRINWVRRQYTLDNGLRWRSGRYFWMAGYTTRQGLDYRC